MNIEGIQLEDKFDINTANKDEKKLENLKYDKDQHQKHIKIFFIKHVPKILLSVLFICIALIYFSSITYDNYTTKLILDKFCYLSMGITIALTSVYLLCTRLEHVYKMYYFNKKILKIKEKY